MKKIVALLLALMLCLGSFPAFADVDLSAYSQEELIALRDLINLELLKRGIEKEVTVPIGMYEVGVDIPAGTYTVKPKPNGYANIEVWKSVSSKYSMSSEFVSDYDKEYIGKLKLIDGNIIEITHGSLVFSPYQGLGF